MNKKRAIQIFCGTIINITLIISLVLTFFLIRFVELWLSALISWGFAIIIIITLRWCFGPDFVSKAGAEWEKEGYSSMSQWWRESSSFNAELFRFAFKYLIPFFILVAIIAGILVAIKIIN